LDTVPLNNFIFIVLCTSAQFVLSIFLYNTLMFFLLYIMTACTCIIRLSINARIFNNVYLRPSSTSSVHDPFTGRIRKEMGKKIPVYSFIAKRRQVLDSDH
jgi:hypothetical protein